MATLQSGEKKKKRIDDPGFFSAGFLSNGVLVFLFSLNGIIFSSSVSDSVNRSTILTRTYS